MTNHPNRSRAKAKALAAAYVSLMNVGEALRLLHVHNTATGQALELPPDAMTAITAARDHVFAAQRAIEMRRAQG